MENYVKLMYMRQDFESISGHNSEINYGSLLKSITSVQILPRNVQVHGISPRFIFIIRMRGFSKKAADPINVGSCNTSGI